MSLVRILALTCASQANDKVTAKWERNNNIKQEAQLNPSNGDLNLNQQPNNPYKTVEFIFGSNVSGTLGVNVFGGMNMGDMTITSQKTSGDATTNLSLDNASMKTLTVGEKNTINITIQNASDKIETIDNKGTMTINNKGQTITTLTNTGGTIDNKSGTITTLTSNQGGNITNAGTITSLTYTAAPTTKAIQTKANTDSITNTGTITTFTNNGGHITNSGNGNITNLTNSNGNVNNSANIQTLQSTNGNINNMKGTISTLTNNNGGSLNNYQGTIENLKITSGDFELNNMQQGRIANIEIAGNGNININDNMNIGYNNGISTFRIASGATPTLNFGEVRTATTAQETYATVKLVDSTNNANQTQAKVAIDKLTIALVSEDTQIGKSVSLANSVSGAANTGVGNVYVKSADFSQDLKQSGFYGKFNAQTQTIDTRFNANLGAAGLFSQAFINQLGRRSLLFDSFLNEASRASLRYKRTQPDTNFDIFVRPYYSKIKTDLADIPEKADGTSSGILAGGHTYFDNSLLMLYGAVEKNKTHLADDVFNFDSDTFLLGSKYSIELAQSHIGQLFGGVDIRGSYTKADLEREPVSGFKSQGDAKNYAYDARVFLASIIYYNLQDHSQYLTPQIGIGHTGAKLKGFDMKGNKLAYKESLDDMTYGITYATASLNWFKRKDNVAIQLDGGVRVNLNNEIDTQTKINNQNFTNHFETSKYYSQLGGAFMWINPYGVDVSLGYKFLFGESATSHTASLRLHKTF
ncbi:hypothetical protein [Campylobacter upsaliensis]|uniref:hypothetical protein n=1 Tax=Campylobacter upsaliensis TaxID=28080 RepID=UPI0022EB18DC|nr:hypothetical protein [Campylobacter upsaliensis]